jgi:3-deoxy-D-manno-octulosonate 8-phosphate phosphatase (KDO 8-P phosphatase)
MEISFKIKISKIQAFIFDIDGVFTDGTILVGSDDVFRSFSMRDGYAVQMAVNQGYLIGVVSGAKQDSVKKRMEGLGVQDVYLAVPTDKKIEFVNYFISKHGLTQDQVLYMGDDVPDWLVMKSLDVLSCCPADAIKDVKEVCHYICEQKGGTGAVREIIELVMRKQGKWLKGF